MYEGKEEMHKYMQYEVSIRVCMGMVANQRKYQYGCHLKTTSQNHYLMCIHGHVHMCTKYKVLCSILWLGVVCTDDNANATDDGQSMTEKALWLTNQMSQ